MTKPSLFVRVLTRLVILCGGRNWLRERIERGRADRLANLRAAQRDRDQFDEAAALVLPLLKANPTLKWRDAVAHLRASGADLPVDNPYLEQLDMPGGAE